MDYLPVESVCQYRLGFICIGKVKFQFSKDLNPNVQTTDSALDKVGSTSRCGSPYNGKLMLSCSVLPIQATTEAFSSATEVCEGKSIVWISM